MAQYQVGTIKVTQGSTIVQSVDPGAPDVLSETAWTAEVSVGDLFYVKDDAVAYPIQSISSDTQLILSSPYLGDTVAPAGTPLAGKRYAIHRDFSINYKMPLLSKGDIGLPVFIQLVVITLDTEMADLDARVTVLEP